MYEKIAIVGAGPSGSSAAIRLLESDVTKEVTIYEKRKQIGFPPRCAGGLHGSRAEAHGIAIPEEVIKARIKKLVFKSPNQTAEFNFSELGFEDLKYYTIDRTKFDQILAKKAESMGAKIETQTEVWGPTSKGLEVLGPPIDGSSLSNRRTVECDIVIAAAGFKEGRFSDLFDVPPTEPKDMAACLQYVMRVKDYPQDTMTFIFGKDVAPGGYSWIFPAGDLDVRIGLGIPLKLAGLPFIAHYLDALVERMCGLKKVQGWQGWSKGQNFKGCMARMLPTTKPLKTGVRCGNILLVGDQLHATDPLSIHEDEPVLIRCDGSTRLLPIKEVATLDGVLEVASLNMESLKIEYVPLDSVIRHRATEPLYYVRLEGGREIKITGNHSLYVCRNNKIISVKTKDLDIKTDFVLAAFSLPNMVSKEIDPQFAKLLGFYVAEGCIRHHDKKNRFHLRLFFGKKERNTLVEEVICACKNLGFEYRIYECAWKFEIHVFDNSGRLEKLHLSEGAKNKRIPPLIFDADNTAKTEFLRALFLGDGSLRIGKQTNYSIIFNTVSQYLANDVSYLLTMLGITNKLGTWTVKARILRGHRILPSKAFGVRIENVTHLQNAKNIWIDHPRGRELAENLSKINRKGKDSLAGIPTYSNRRTNREWLRHRRTSKYAKLMESDLCFLRIKQVERCPASDWLYDLSVPPTTLYENFIAGTGAIVSHNTGGGIIPAILTGRAAADAILKGNIRCYDQLWKPILEENNIRYRAKKLFAMSDKKLDRLVELLSQFRPKELKPGTEVRQLLKFIARKDPLLLASLIRILL